MTGSRIQEEAAGPPMPGTVPDARPILVTGAHRSGSTWVGRTLAEAAGTAYVHEPFSPIVRPGVHAPPMKRWFTYIDERNEADFLPALARTLAFRYDWLAEARSLRSPRDAGRMLVHGTRFARYRRTGARPIWKDPIALLASEWLVERLGMRPVILVRHPAAFASSLRFRDWTFPFEDLASQPLLLERLPDDQVDAVRRFARNPPPLLDQAALIWSILYGYVMGLRRRSDFLIVRHEDVSLDPVERFAELYAALGLEFTDAIAASIRRRSGQGAPTAPGAPMDISRNSRANMRAWKRRMSESDVARVRARTGSVAENFYSPDEW